jgi:signal transduction histidine kinase
VLASIRGFDRLRLREFKGRYDLDLAHRALQAAERARSRLFVNLSHDFRTPLALIHSEAALLQRSVVADPGHAHAGLERIRLNASALAELTNELLELARLEAGRAPVAPLNFELAPLLRELAAQFAGRVADFELEIDADCAAFADPAHVRRIMANLIANSARAAKAKVSLRCLVIDARLVIDVVDDGPGIPEQQRLAIFERFTSFDAAGSLASGIGLPVARELSELNGGRLWLVEDAPRTTFRVALPRATGALVQLASAAASSPVTQPLAASAVSVVSPAGARSLLVVEDHPDMRRLLESLLGEHFRVRVAADVAGARRALTEATPDAILCDILLPDGDGFDVLAYVRADRHFDGVPLLFVSALATAEQRTRGLAAGVDDYVTKPFDAPELMARVHLACERAAQRRRALDAQRREFLAELHDGVTASLSRAALLLGAAQAEGAAPALLEAANEAVRDGLSEARTVLTLTSAGTVPWPVVVERVRLQLVEAEAFGLQLELNADNDGSAGLLSAIEAHALERAARELVTNAVKHAAARTLRATLSAQQGRAVFTFSDDGVGLRGQSSGSGLAILKRRIARLSGSLSVAPGRAAGTSVTLAFPLSLARSVEALPVSPGLLGAPLSAALQ